MHYEARRVSGLLHLTVFDTRDKDRLVNSLHRTYGFSEKECARLWLGVTVLRAIIWDLIFRHILDVEESERWRLISEVSSCLLSSDNSTTLPADYFCVLKEERDLLPVVLATLWPERYSAPCIQADLPYTDAIVAVFEIRRLRAYEDFDRCHGLFAEDLYWRMERTLLEQIRDPADTSQASRQQPDLEDEKAKVLATLVRGHHEAALKVWHFSFGEDQMKGESGL